MKFMNFVHAKSVKCKDFTLEAQNNVSVKSGANTTIEAGGDMNQQASGTLSMDASLITLN